ncbi:MAG TPA: RHS repeat-associated core domain-containing protein [Bacteroidales bacterium]|nr:RHS repeat-associated core domain-containing protein [Bacteroidales bacterium]
MNFAYDSWNRPSTALRNRIKSITYPDGEVVTYVDQQQPHTLQSAGSSSFGWDFNGNMVSQNQRYLCWDEENRLGAVRDPEHLSLYLYNAGGERVWKFTGEVAQMTLSGEIQIDMAYLTNKTLYASSFFVATDMGYTKHFFAGAERVCSKLGGGMALAPTSVTDSMVDPLESDYEEISNQLSVYLERFANCAPNELKVYFDLDPVLYGITGDMLERNDYEEQQYFFHPDHLGSSSFISDAAGQGYQHLQYMPFGETFISQKVDTWGTPYQFSAKENDEETGYSYFGARYYNSDVSVWLSVDPIAIMYPALSPFMYVGGNTINQIDPDGRYFFGLFGSTKAQRKAARELVAKSGGTIHDFHKKSINVTYSSKESNSISSDYYGDGYRYHVVRFDKSGHQYEAGIAIYPEQITTNSTVSASIATIGGMAGGMQQSYKYGDHTVKYAEYINGKLRSADVLTRSNQLQATKVIKGLKVAGKVCTIASVAVSTVQFINSDDQSGADYARLAGSMIITGVAFIPLVGPVLSIGLGVADSFGAFDGIYNHFNR